MRTKSRPRLGKAAATPRPLVTRTNSGFLEESNFYDPLYEPRTLQFLFSMFSFISVIAYWYHQSRAEKRQVSHPMSSNAFDVQQGLCFVILFVLGYFVTQSRDGVLIRPHPAVWRFVHGMGIVYVMLLLAMLPFQPKDMREMLRTLISPSLGNVSVNTDYGVDCRFTWTNFSTQFFEFFTLSHMLGYVVKALVYRDWLLLLTHSVLFELIEISFAHLLPNFNECWWDHFILDVFGANLLGSFIGMKLVTILEQRGGKQVEWERMPALQHLRGAQRKARRILLQFTPLTWDANKWELTHNSTHFMAAVIVVCCGLSVETCIFFLKYFLWVEMSNRYVFVIMATKAALTAHAYREWYVYIVQDDDRHEKNEEMDGKLGGGGGGGGGETRRKRSTMKGKECKKNETSWNASLRKSLRKGKRTQRLGQNAWLCIAVIVAELAVCIKWSIDPGFEQPYPPRAVSAAWSSFFLLASVWYHRRFKQRKNDLLERGFGYCALLPLALLLLNEIRRTLFFDPPPVPVGRLWW